MIFDFFLAFDFCRFCVVPATTANDLRLQRIFYARTYPLHWHFPVECSVLNNVFGMTRSITGDWTRELPHSKGALYHYTIEEAVLNWGLNPGAPALEASTLPLGYRGASYYLHIVSYSMFTLYMISDFIHLTWQCIFYIFQSCKLLKDPLLSKMS